MAISLGLPVEVAASLASVEPSELESLLEASGKGAVDQRLKAAGVKSMGHRLKLANALQSLQSAHGTAAGALSPAVGLSPSAGAGPPPPTPPPPAATTSASSVAASPADPDTLAAAAQRGVDVPSLQAMARASDRAGISAALKAAGYKVGERLKVEAALIAPPSASAAPSPPPSPPAGSFTPYSTDFFGTKRGQCLKCLRVGFDADGAASSAGSCRRYEAKVVQMNHCSGPSDTEMLNCLRCGCKPAEHADLGAWATGEPMAVTEEGRRLKSLRVS